MPVTVSRKWSALLSIAFVAGIVLALAGATAAAQEQLCQDPNGYCTPMVQPACVDKFMGAGAAVIPAANDGCPAQRRSYMACISSAAQLCSPRAEDERQPLKHAGGCTSEDARTLWSELKTSNFVEDLEGFAEICAGTPQAMLAGNRAKRLRDKAKRAAEAGNRGDELSGWRIVEAQAHLSRLGLLSGEPQGRWSEKSRSAMKRFQKNAGLPANGVLDSATLEALRARPTAAEKPLPSNLDGEWEGQYRYNDPRPPVAFRLKLRQRGAELIGRSDEPQTFGAPGAGILHADWVGRISSEGLLAFVKTYDGTGGQTHSIQYTGRLVAPNRIEGRWNISPQINGSFALTRR